MVCLLGGYRVAFCLILTSSMEDSVKKYKIQLEATARQIEDGQEQLKSAQNKFSLLEQENDHQRLEIERLTLQTDDIVSTNQVLVDQSDLHPDQGFL